MKLTCSGAGREEHLALTRLSSRFVFLACVATCVDGLVQTSELGYTSLLRGSSSNPDLTAAVMKRSAAELAIASNANRQSQITAWDALAQQNHYAAAVAAECSRNTYAKIKDIVPTARSELVKTKMYAMMARQHKDHAEKVEKGFQQIPKMAAQASEQALLSWIKRDATKTAEEGALSGSEAAALRVKKIANAVAAAAEPYHLALLRNQKFAAEAYSKAKSAQQSYKALQDKASKLALTAQQFQASGDGVDAREMFATASSMMNEADNMRQWATKLYDEANSANANAGSYSASQHQAAANAAATQIINAPMKLP